MDVPPAHWVDALTAAGDRLGCDWLTAVEELDRGYRIAARIWSDWIPAKPALMATSFLYTLPPEADG